MWNAATSYGTRTALHMLKKYPDINASSMRKCSPDV